MHALIMRGERTAGRYKQYLNEIGGSVHVPVPPSDVPAHMDQMVTWLRQTTAPLVWKAAVGHAWLTHIHPFDDGNGRIARLLANYVLGFGCFPPLIVRSSADRARYLDALSQSDLAGDISRLVRLFARVLRRGVSLMEKPDFAWSLFEADLRVRDADIFTRWKETTDRFFGDVAAELLLRGIDFTRVGSLSPGDYGSLARKSPAGATWYARVGDANSSKHLLVWVGYVSARMSRGLETDQVFPSFFLSERDPNPRSVKPYLSRVRGLEPQFDEITLVADERRALLRRGGTVTRVGLNAAAELFAALLGDYVDSLLKD